MTIEHKLDSPTEKQVKVTVSEPINADIIRIREFGYATRRVNRSEVRVRWAIGFEDADNDGKFRRVEGAETTLPAQRSKKLLNTLVTPGLTIQENIEGLALKALANMDVIPEGNIVFAGATGETGAPTPF